MPRWASGRMRFLSRTKFRAFVGTSVSQGGCGCIAARPTGTSCGYRPIDCWHWRRSASPFWAASPTGGWVSRERKGGALTGSGRRRCLEWLPIVSPLAERREFESGFLRRRVRLTGAFHGTLCAGKLSMTTMSAGDSVVARYLLDIGKTDRAIHWAVDAKGCGQAVVSIIDSWGV